MKIKALIYDFDGVICDSVNVKTDAFAELYKDYGADIQKQVVDYHLQHGGISRFEKIRYYHTQLLGTEIVEEEVTRLADVFASLVKQKVIDSSYIPGVDKFIEKYSGVVPQFICTGTPETEILEITANRKINNFFTGIYGAPKKKAEIIKIILLQTNLQPEEVLFFGDAMTDYNAAKEMEVPFIGIASANTDFPPGTKVINDFNGLFIETL